MVGEPLIQPRSVLALAYSAASRHPRFGAKEVVKVRASKRAAGASGVQLGEAAVRSAILQGAATVFAKHGARAASVEDILAAAKLSRRTFYRFYQSKEDVLLALYRVGTAGLLEA